MSERNVCANREVHLMFETLVQEWFAESVDDYSDFIKALLAGNVKAMVLSWG